MEMTKESRDTIITSLYEKYGKGEISATQREQLIQKVNSKFYTEMTAVTTEKAKSDDKPEKKTKELSSKEKYDLFKTTVYDKCKNGEITEEFREELLEKAREKFLPEEDKKETKTEDEEESE
jgi:hypothetical protein